MKCTVSGISKLSELRNFENGPTQVNALRDFIYQTLMDS